MSNYSTLQLHTKNEYMTLKLTKGLFFTLLSISLSFQLAAQRDFSKVEIKTEKLSDNIYVLFGSGGNIGICAGEDGVIMIDDQYAPLSEKIEAAIAEISEHPVKYLLNTHWHGDHTGGNEHFGSKGATIIAHDNVRARLSKEQTMKAFNRTVPAAPTSAWPIITFSEKMSLYANGEDLMVIHVHNAHTDGDSFIYFPKSNVLHMGDTYFNGRFPFIDLSSGGTIDGIINAVNTALFIVDEDTKIIPGHGAVSNKKELMAYRDTLLGVRTKVKKAVDKGLSIENIKAAGFLEGLDDWGSGFINGERFLDILYADFSR